MADTVADVLLARLREWGIEQVFAYPGDGINGLLAAWGRAKNEPQFVQARHEEMAAFEAVGYAKFSGNVGVCMATCGPGAIHLLNGLYDAKLDHVPVVAIVGQTEPLRDGRLLPAGGRPAQPLQGRVPASTCRWSPCPEQLPNLIDRAIRIALAERAPTCIIIPSDVQELRLRGARARVQDGPLQPRDRLARPPRPTTRRSARRPRSSTPGARWRILVGQGARGARAEVDQVADLLGAGVAKACWARTCCPTSCRG